MTKGKYTKGFTLVELLVVIAIIAILAGAMFLVINPAKLMAKTRDAKRIGEINELNKALAAALADSKATLLGTVGTPVTGNSSGSNVATGGGWLSYTPGTNGNLSDYIPVLPADPKNTGVMLYYFASDGVGWELNTVLESLDNAGKATGDGGNAGTAGVGGTCATMPDTACRYELGTDVGLNLI